MSVYPRASAPASEEANAAANARADRWKARYDDAATRLARVEDLARKLLVCHGEVVMDTPEDRELHAKVIATFDAALTAAATPTNLLRAPETEGDTHG